MKFSPLTAMYFLVIGLFIYSCANEELLPTDQSKFAFELVSPDHYTLADNEADLIAKMRESLDPVYGTDYNFTITEINYIVATNMTDAEIVYETDLGVKRNMRFFWPHPKEAMERNIDLTQIQAIPAPVCSGDCDEGDDYAKCQTRFNLDDEIYYCTCDKYVADGGNCTMKIRKRPHLVFSCEGECIIFEHFTFDCTLHFNPFTSNMDCYCAGAAHDDCGPVQIEVDPNPDIGDGN